MNRIGRTRAVHAPPAVLYVGGYGRSGSTLVGRVLGEAAYAVCIGETRFLAGRALLHDVDCGCGVPFSACPFWTAVGEAAFGGWRNVDLPRLLELDRALSPLRRLPLHRMARLRPHFAAALDEYAAWLGSVYAAVRDVSGAKLIVDTSKEPQFASVLARARGIDLRFAHLVRDSRAVAYSWARTKRLPSPIGGQALMPRYPARDAGPKWLIWNAAFHALSRRFPYARVSYEDFVDSPHTALAALAPVAAPTEPATGARLERGRVWLGDHHIFSGNPMRDETGWIELRRDEEWQTAQRSLQFAAVTAATLPLLRRYGYPTIPAARRGVAS